MSKACLDRVFNRFAGIGEDSTEQNTAQLAIQSVRDRYRSLVLASAQIVWTTDANGSTLIHSSSWQEVTGQADGAWRRGGWLDAVHPDDRARLTAAWQAAVDGKTVFDAEYRLRTVAGTYLHTRARGVPVFEPDGSVREWVGMNIDITDQRRAEQALLDAKEAAEQANRAKSEFLSRMSHELRTPLHAILGFSQLLEADLVQADQRESVAQIIKGGRHLLKLIDAVLEVANLEHGGAKLLTLEPVAVAEVIQDVLGLVLPLAVQAKISIHAPQAELCGWTVQADRQRLKQVLLNLLTNALKYNSERGTVTLTCSPVRSDLLRISIADTGPGIPPEKIHRLFTPFDRLGAEQRGIEGTGLGLALCKALVHEMGARIHVSSVPGQGSVFCVELPLLAAVACPRRPDTVASVELPASTGCLGKVLYVEDNLDNFRLLESILRRRPGIKLLSALHGRMALALARQHQPELILLDLHLPDLSGEELLRHLRSDAATRDIPVVVVSADAWPSRTRSLLDMGVLRYLTKPIDVKELLEVFDVVLRKPEVQP